MRLTGCLLASPIKVSARLMASSLFFSSEVMLIEVQAQRIMLNFPDLSGPDAMQIMPKGEFRGRKTTWSNRKIEQKYKTTERRVQKTWSIRSDGRLLVQVMIKPKGGKKRTFSRVFDRA